MVIKITGDGSYLGLVDVASYESFVGPDWAENPKLLEPHFIEQMQKYAGLFWDTNIESGWLVEVNIGRSQNSGFREFTGSIEVTGGKLALFDYDQLTMMAQFEKYTVDKYIKENVIDLENGKYKVTIVQVNDPKTHFPDGKEVDFYINLEKVENLEPSLEVVPWSSLK